MKHLKLNKFRELECKSIWICTGKDETHIAVANNEPECRRCGANRTKKDTLPMGDIFWWFFPLIRSSIGDQETRALLAEFANCRKQSVAARNNAIRAMVQEYPFAVEEFEDQLMPIMPAIALALMEKTIWHFSIEEGLDLPNVQQLVNWAALAGSHQPGRLRYIARQIKAMSETLEAHPAPEAGDA